MALMLLPDITTADSVPLCEVACGGGFVNHTSLTYLSAGTLTFSVLGFVGLRVSLSP